MITYQRNREISITNRDVNIVFDIERKGRKMKRLSITLLTILFMTATANAILQQKQDLAIYRFTEKSTEYTCDANNVWEKSNATKTGYIVMQISQGSPITYVKIITTFRAPDPNGKMQKYFESSLPIGYSIAYAEFGRKETWIINLSSQYEQTVLSGDAKRIRIKAFGEYVPIPTTLKGSHNWYYKSADNILHTGTSTLTLRYHSTFTNGYYSDPDLLDGESAIRDIIFPYLTDRGYEIIPG
jgi:hypothetical protein